ncbi:MAG: hypothetical protein NC081_12310 [Roseburia sp.]|nr:hypothetical protein [Roseburia sp.]
MNRLENLVEIAKINELLGKKEEEKKKCDVLLWVLAIIGIVAAVAAIGYAVYKYFTPDYLEDFEDDFDDDFEAEEDDDIFEDESDTEEE